MRTPGPWEARTGAGSTAVYQEGTVHAVAVGLNAADAEFIAKMPRLFKLMERLCDMAEGYANETGHGRDTIREARRELRRMPE